MRVLRSGIDLYVQKCKCGCIFAYSMSDTVSVQTGIQEYDTQVKCPECGYQEHAFFFFEDRYKEELNENRN
ncbi:MAG: hypothetical protein IKU15_03095 [Clostridia bacterium]|nr:hypothetical protein [Clostridia bacterium]